MKKNEDAAAKKKPKTSAAQIRVQKGTYLRLWTHDNELTWCVAGMLRFDGAGSTVNDEDEFPWSRRSPQLLLDHHPWWGCVNIVLIFWIWEADSSCVTLSLFHLAAAPCRHVQGWRFPVFFHHQHQLPSRPTQSQVHAKGKHYSLSKWLSERLNAL